MNNNTINNYLESKFDFRLFQLYMNDHKGATEFINASSNDAVQMTYSDVRRLLQNALAKGFNEGRIDTINSCQDNFDDKWLTRQKELIEQERR